MASSGQVARHLPGRLGSAPRRVAATDARRRLGFVDGPRGAHSHVWHVWDGHREGFSALVNYHKPDPERLKSLAHTYLGDWIRTQKIDANAGKSGAAGKVAKARALQKRLAAILQGEESLDVFVLWKSIDQQPIGWYPDLDDGERLNIRPFSDRRRCWREWGRRAPLETQH